MCFGGAVRRSSRPVTEVCGRRGHQALQQRVNIEHIRACWPHANVHERTNEGGNTGRMHSIVYHLRMCDIGKSPGAADTRGGVVFMHRIGPPSCISARKNLLWLSTKGTCLVGNVSRRCFRNRSSHAKHVQ